MKSYCFSLSIILTLACASKPAATDEIRDITRINPPSAAEAPSEETPPFNYQPPDNLVADTALYIGTIGVYEETKEYYTSLFYLEGILGIEPFQYLSDRLDSLVYKRKDEEYIRKRLPMEIAKQFFNLAGLDRISVYNMQGELVTDATLVRIESFDVPIEGEFVAVFKPMIPDGFSKEVAYCISQSEHETPYLSVKLEVQPVENEELSKALLTKLKISKEEVDWLIHKKVFPNTTLSIISNKESYLIETTRGESTTLCISTEYSFMDFTPVHLKVNGKPALLIKMGLPDTDAIWTSLCIYSGSEYELMSRNRVHVSKG